MRNCDNMVVKIRYWGIFRFSPNSQDGFSYCTASKFDACVPECKYQWQTYCVEDFGKKN